MNESVFKVIRHNVILSNINTPIFIQPFGDVHRYSPNCSEEKWLAFLKWAEKEHTSNTYYIGMGDYDDAGSTSERKILTSKDLHEQTRATLDKRCGYIPMENFAKEIDFMRGNLIGLIEGNHFWQFEDGTTSTQLLAEKLDCEWLGGIAYIRLSIKMKEGKKINTCIDIVAAHGKAGGQLIGTSLNQVEKLREVFPQADIYLFGHDHHKGAWSVSVLTINDSNGSLTVHQERQWFGRTGSFLRGYVDGVSSYEVARLYRPTDIGIIRFRVDFRRNRKNNEDIINKDVHCWS